MINYKRNYKLINDLVEDKFFLSKSSLEIFKKRMEIGTYCDEQFLPLIDENFRIEIDLNLNDLEEFDDSWKIFKNNFGEFCVDEKITYENFFFGSIVYGKNKIKLFKKLRNYYEDNETYYNKVNSSISFDDINDTKLPVTEMKLVISFNLSDMFMCSSGQEWTSCLNLNSEFTGCYWIDLPSLAFDKNRCMIYLASQEEEKSSVFEIEVEKMYRRTFAIMDNEDIFNILKWYPSEFFTSGILKVLNNKVKVLNFKNIDKTYKQKFPLDLPSFEDGTKFYLFQDKTYLVTQDKISFGVKGHYYVKNGEIKDGNYFNYEGGLKKLIENNEKIIASNIITTCDEICYYCGSGIRSTADLYIMSENNTCERCFNAHSYFCESCQEYYHGADYDTYSNLCVHCNSAIEDERF